MVSGIWILEIRWPCLDYYGIYALIAISQFDLAVLVHLKSKLLISYNVMVLGYGEKFYNLGNLLGEECNSPSMMGDPFAFGLNIFICEQFLQKMMYLYDLTLCWLFVLVYMGWLCSYCVGLKELSYSPFLAVVCCCPSLCLQISALCSTYSPNEFCLVLVVEMAAVVGL